MSKLKYFSKITFELLFILIIKCQDLPNVNIISQQSEHYAGIYNMSCVISGKNMNSALIWNKDIEPYQYSTTTSVSHFVPPRDSAYNCEINSDQYDKCNSEWISNSWKLQNSLESKLEIVTDRRWEDFNIVQTDGTYTFNKIGEIKETTFKIHLSVRTVEAHIFLCDNDYPPNGKCYWFLISGWQGLQSGIRKCAKENVPYNARSFPKKDCQPLQDSIQHSIPILLAEEWEHFSLEINNKDILFWRYGEDKPMLSYTDKKGTIDVQYLIVGSRRDAPGLWKVHNYDHIFTITATTSRLGPTIYHDKKSICVSLFVAMCKQCSLQVDIMYTYSTTKTAKSILLLPKKEMAWQEETLFVTIPYTSVPIEFEVTTICSENCDNPYWAIDKFELCAENEIRVLSALQSKIGATCQIIQYPRFTLAQTDVKEELSESHCPVGTFGSNCIKCSQLFGAATSYCEKCTICERGVNNKSICKCTAGYTGQLCENRCENSRYGYSCNETCGYCAYAPCHPVTGECSPKSCLSNFTGPQCKIPPFPVLLNPPKLITVGHTTCLVQIENNSYVGPGTPQLYKLQYRKDQGGSTQWLETESYFYSYNQPIEITNLETLTNYGIRAILITNKNEYYDKEYVPTINIETSCAAAENSDIHIIPSNISAILTIKNNKDSCKSKYYQVLVGNRNRKLVSETYEYTLSNLLPFTVYQVIITNSLYDTTLEIFFKTEEGAPGKVTQLRETEVDATSMRISWHPPIKENGLVRYYKIYYKHVRYLACENENDEASMKTIQESSNVTTLHGLLPYSLYSIDVSAFTVIDGESNRIQVETLATETPEESEIPTISEVVPAKTNADIILKEQSCTLIKGPVNYFVQSICSNDWCEKQPVVKNVSHIDNKNPISISNLLPYSEYTVTVKVGRTNGNVFAGHSMTRKFNTKPSEPHLVQNIVAYCKNESAVWLRFPPPYPPTGIIAEYFINYCYIVSTFWSSYDECKYKYIPVKKCKLWENQHCISIEELLTNQMYKITVQAKNKGTEFNNPTSINVQTIQEPPGAVENLKSMWDDYYNLTLTWNHPSIMNGPLTKYIIRIFSSSNLCYEQHFLISEEMYEPTYNYTIEFNKCYSSELKIYVSAFNLMEGAPMTINVVSPPVTPTFTREPSVEHVTNTTITINIPEARDLSTHSMLYVLVSDPKQTTGNVIILPAILNNLALFNKNQFPWLVEEMAPNIDSVRDHTLIVGNSTFRGNKMLEIDTNYLISIVLINTFKDLHRFKMYEIRERTAANIIPEKLESSNNALFALLLLLLLPVVIWMLISKKKIQMGDKSWMAVFHSTPTLVNVGNPDVIPLTNKVEKPRPTSTQPQILVKQKMPLRTENVTNQPVASTSKVKPSKFSKPIQIDDFEKYVKDSIENGELQRQHQLFPRGLTKPCDYGLLPQNKSKNRYNNLIAYDQSRVKLTKIDNDPYSDYINANYVDGYLTKNAYIATQGPKVATVNDFWRMIWQENVNVIVMLANVIEGGKKKSEQYWPNVNESVEYRTIKVEYVSSRVFADYEYRTFTIHYNNAQRKVEQLHFTSWPDHGVPLYSQSLVPFLRKLQSIPQGTSPIVVHCSAGVGRTGTIILCDICLRMAEKEGVIDILKHQHKLREQRANLVDNIEQYKLVHLVLLEYLVVPESTITCDEEMEKVITDLLDSNKVLQQLKYIDDSGWQDNAMQPSMQVVPHPEWSSKNRFQDIIPLGYGRVYLSRYPVSNEHSDYINAIEVDGFKSPQQFIATQQPLRSTISDFWRMVDEKDATTIINLNKINLGNETSCVFWPTAKSGEIQPVPYISLQYHNKTNNDYFSTIIIHLQNKKDKNNVKHSIVKLITLKTWPALQLLPDSDQSLLQLWEEAERVSRGDTDKPIVVTCYDGATACGLFTALSFVVEKMKLEQECDICLAVKTVRRNRKQFVTTLDQFVFLYRVAMTYLTCFDLYSNFTTVVPKKL